MTDLTTHGQNIQREAKFTAVYHMNHTTPAGSS